MRHNRERWAARKCGDISAGVKELLSVFNAHAVKYLIVGGYAVSFHAQPRATKDIEILVKADAANAKAVYAALTEFGAPLKDLTAESFAETASFFRIGREPVAVDLLPGSGGWRVRSIPHAASCDLSQ